MTSMQHAYSLGRAQALSVFGPADLNGLGGSRPQFKHACSVLLVCGLLAAGTVFAAAEEPHPVGQGDMVVMLSRIQTAAQKLNYSGTFIYQEKSDVQSSRITHMVDAGGETEKLEILDGKVMECIRHNAQVRCFDPSTKLVEESNAKQDNFPALLASPASDLDAHYKFTLGGIERVASRNCQVVALEPRDAARYGYRLWADQDTGLLLKAQTLNEHGEVLDQVAFTDIAIGVPIDRIHVRPSFPSTDSWRIQKSDSSPANLTAQGWVVTAPIPGFQKIMEVKHPFAGNREVGQMVFSDGLAAISVFIEPADLATQHPGQMARGPINIASKRSGDYWLTVVGEAPSATIHQLIDSVEFRPVK